MRKFITLIISLVLLLSVIVGCGQEDQSLSNTNESVTETHYDYPIALDIQGVINEADIVVIGKYEQYDSSWNMARNPDNITKEDPNMYVEGKLYRFTVDKYLKGNGSSSILVNKKYKNVDGQIDERFIEPNFSEPVVLFLKYEKDYNNYFGAIQPFEFKLINNKLQVKTTLQQVKQSFGNEIPLSEILTTLSQ
jgi:hypothetical protein